MDSKLEAELQARIEEFAADITAILTAAVADSVQVTLAGGARRKPRGTAARKTTSSKASKRSKKTRRKKGSKRSPEELEVLTNALLKEIKRKGNRRIEEIGEAMGFPTKELALPAKKLLAAKKVKTKGKRRATRYSAR